MIMRCFLFNSWHYVLWMDQGLPMLATCSAQRSSSNMRRSRWTMPTRRRRRWSARLAWRWETCHSELLNSLWLSDAIWGQRSGSTLAQIMACCLMAPSHYLNQVVCPATRFFCICSRVLFTWTYHKFSNIRCTKFQNVNVSHLVL